MPNIAATLSLNFPAITALCKGDPGNTLLNGGGAPNALLGNEGDFYIDTGSYLIYGPKSGGVWGAGTILNNNSAAPVWFSSSSTVSANSGRWESSYTFLRANSARYQSTTSNLSSLSARWESDYTNSRTYSGRWDTVYMQVSALSSGWGSGSAGTVYTTVQAYSARWETTYAQVSALSSGWGTGGGGGGPGADLGVRALTGVWNSTSTTVSTFSGWWTNAYTGLTAASGGWQWAYQNSLTGAESWNNSAYYATSVLTFGEKWNTAYTTTSAFSARWTTNYTHMTAFSGYWQSISQLISSYDGVTTLGWVTSAENVWNTTWDKFLGPSGAFIPTSLYNPGYIPGNRPSEWMRRMDLYDQIALLFTTDYPAQQAIEDSILGSSPGPIVTMGINAELPEARTPAGVVSATNVYVLSSDAAYVSKLLNRTIINTSTTVGRYIRIPYQTVNWPIGSQVKVLQLGTAALRVSAEPPTVLSNRTGDLGPGQRVTNVGEGYTLIKTGTNQWYCLSTYL